MTLFRESRLVTYPPRYPAGLVLDFVPPVPPPAAPTGLSASTIDADTIRLTWTDNATDEEGYAVEQSTVSASGPFTAVDSLPANTTLYDVDGLSAGTEYWFRVYATKTGANSTYSNVATATTTAANQYPAIAQKATVRPINDIQVDVAEDGGVRGVDLSASNVYRISLLHPMILLSDWLIIRAFYDTWSGQKVIVDPLLDTFSYDCLFQGEPVPETVNATRVNVRVTFVGSRRP